MSDSLRPLLISRARMPWPDGRSYPTAEQIAEGLLEDGEFRALRLGSCLRTPGGELIADAVGMVISPVYRTEFGLAIDGLTLAAEMQ